MEPVLEKQEPLACRWVIVILTVLCFVFTFFRFA